MKTKLSKALKTWTFTFISNLRTVQTLWLCLETTSLAVHVHCVKNVRIRRYSGPHFPTFGMNTERYGVTLRIHSKCGKMRTRITPNTDTFYTVLNFFSFSPFFSFSRYFYKFFPDILLMFAFNKISSPRLSDSVNSKII